MAAAPPLEWQWVRKNVHQATVPLVDPIMLTAGRRVAVDGKSVVYDYDANSAELKHIEEACAYAVQRLQIPEFLRPVIRVALPIYFNDSKRAVRVNGTGWTIASARLTVIGSDGVVTNVAVSLRSDEEE